MTSFSSATTQSVPPSSSHTETSAACRPEPTSRALHKLTDQEREAAIKKAGQIVESNMAEWERSGCFAAKGRADYALRCMETLIRGRSPEMVANLEILRGLR